MTARRDLEPETPAAKLAAAMMEVCDDSDLPGLRAIVMLHYENPDDELNAVTALHGYDHEDGDTAAITDLFLYLRSIFEANGKTMLLVPMQGPSPS